jgi:hypothetical protein
MRISAAPLVAMACHCTGCQKLTGGAYSLTLMIPPGGFEVVEGEVVLGALHRAESQHYYCSHCKSWLYTKAAMLQGATNFRPTMLEDASWVAPYVDMMVAEKLPGVATGAARAYPNWPPPEDFGALMEAYAREGARPE